MAFRYAFGSEFDVLTAASGEEALAILHEHDVAVLLADQRMPGMTGVELCARARALRPDAYRIIVSAFLDAQAAIDAINRGQVSRFIVKPWRNADLAEAIHLGIEHVDLERAVRSLELALLQSGQGRVLGGAMVGMVHEIRSALRGLRASLGELAMLHTALAAPASTDTANATALASAREALATAEVATKYLDTVTSRIWEVDHAPADSCCDAARVVRGAVRMVRQHLAPGVTVTEAIEREPLVALHEGALGQIVLNLLANAVEATSQSAAPQVTITVRLDVDGEHALLVVEDTGPGIDPSDLERVFEPRFSTKGKGRGAGLTLARGLVLAAGGDIEVHGTPGRVTRFGVRLPIAADAAKRP